MTTPDGQPLSLLQQVLAARAAATDRRLRAFIYARRSYDPHNRARSIKDQTYEGRAMCERNGWEVGGVFEDPDNSASRHSRKARPDYDEMVGAVEAGECEVIVSWESVRLSRDITVFTRLADLCERNRVLLCLNGTVYDMANSQQRYFAQMTVLQGSYEADTIRDRNLRTMDALARDGRPTGIIPYGFRREYDQKTGELLRQFPDPVQADIVAELTKKVGSGSTLMSLARTMQQRGVPGPDAPKPWTSMTVRALVKRPANIGKRVHRGSVVGDAAWDAIVEEADYYAALKVLADPSRLTRKDTAVKYMMSGLAFCASAHKLRPKQISGRKAYTCPVCGGASIRVDVLDDLVSATVLEYVEQPAFAAALMLPSADAQTQAQLALVAELEAQLAEARAMVGTVLDGRLALSVADFAVISGQLTQQIEAAREKARDATVPGVLREIGGPGAREVWERMSLEQRRSVIRELVRVTVNPAGQGVRTLRPERVSWKWSWGPRRAL